MKCGEVTLAAPAWNIMIAAGFMGDSAAMGGEMIDIKAQIG